MKRLRWFALLLAPAIALGDNGFFIFDVPNQHVAAVHSADFSVLGLNETGEKVAEVAVPAIGVEPEGPIEDPAPITVDTISDASDFTKVLGVRGRVNAEGAGCWSGEHPTRLAFHEPSKAPCRSEIVSKTKGRPPHWHP